MVYPTTDVGLERKVASRSTPATAASGRVRGNQVAVKIDLPVARVGTSLPRRALAAGSGSIWVF